MPPMPPAPAGFAPPPAPPAPPEPPKLRKSGIRTVGPIRPRRTARGEGHGRITIGIPLSISFPDARIVDMQLSELEKRVNGSADAIDAAKRGQVPLVVI